MPTFYISQTRTNKSLLLLQVTDFVSDKRSETRIYKVHVALKQKWLFIFEDGLDREKNICKINEIIRHLSNSDEIKKGGYRHGETISIVNKISVIFGIVP